MPEPIPPRPTRAALGLALLLACTAALVFAFVARLRHQPAALALTAGPTSFLGAYAAWLYAARLAPAFRKHAADFPASVRACQNLFLAAALLSSIIALTCVYVLK